MLGLKFSKKEDTANSSIYDLVIIGAGPAGLSAGIYAGRSRLKTLIIEEMISGGQAATTETLENYPGFQDGVGGVELAQRMEEQAKKFGTEIIYEKVTATNLTGKTKEVFVSNRKFEAKTVIIASGGEPRKLNVPGSEKFHGRGISYCATCDGALFRDKRVVIVGGGNSAIEEGIFMQRFTDKVTFVQDLPDLTAEKILRERIMSYKNIDFYFNTLVKSIAGDDFIKSIGVQDQKSKVNFEIETDGVFVYIGYVPKTGFVDKEIKLNKQGYIITDENMLTNIEGVFCAGDIREKDFRQVVTAASDGAIAAHSAEKYLEKHKEV